MAINKALVRLLLRESKRRPFDGTVLQLGRQEVWTDDNALMNIAELEKKELAMIGGEYATKKSKFVDCMCMDDVKFFRTLGFSSVHSTDVSDFEGADFLHDMNL